MIGRVLDEMLAGVSVQRLRMHLSPLSASARNRISRCFSFKLSREFFCPEVNKDMLSIPSPCDVNVKYFNIYSANKTCVRKRWDFIQFVCIKFWNSDILITSY